MAEVLEADLANAEHATALVELLDTYALDEMGGGEALSPFVRKNLASRLAEREDALVVLAFADGTPAGLAICFEGFSTFACRPLMNIHDLVVAPPFRGRGISTRLLAKVEEVARRAGCCRLTLEVLAGNQVAKSAYLRFGFAGYELDPKLGRAEFWQMRLSPVHEDSR